MSRTAASTQPVFDAPLPRVSDFRRRLEAAAPGGDSLAGHTRLSALDASLLQDLQRFEPEARTRGTLEVLEVVAAAVRHGRTLRLMLQHDERVLPLQVSPRRQQATLPLPLAQWGHVRWKQLRVLQVERVDEAESAPPVEALQGSAAGHHTGPLPALMWALALQGARAALLPEIAGPAAYRIAPGTDLTALDLTGSLGAAVTRLRRETVSLREIASWPGLDAERATRLLNGLYLQAGLMVTRTHPAAAQVG
jgi:hypothetical protein